MAVPRIEDDALTTQAVAEYDEDVAMRPTVPSAGEVSSVTGIADGPLRTGGGLTLDQVGLFSGGDVDHVSARRVVVATAVQRMMADMGMENTELRKMNKKERTSVADPLVMKCHTTLRAQR